MSAWSRRRPAVLAAAVVALVAGCGAAPEVVAGQPAPLTPVPTASTPAGHTPAGTTTPGGPSPTPIPAPVLPTAYETAEIAAHGVTVRVPVPAGWIRARTTRGYQYGDPTRTLLLVIDLTARVPEQTARTWWAELEPKVAAERQNYRRLDARDVPGYFDGALDWTYTFDRDGFRRQVVDRLLLSRSAGVAVYFSALQRDFGRMLPVWDRAQQQLAIS